MKILVVDVAAEHSGALTILDMFIKECQEDKDNEYYFAIGTLNYSDSENVHFIRVEWIKKSYLHRLFFDECYIMRIIHQVCPDKILSLQNKSVFSGQIIQDVYFHNVLLIAEKQFSFQESKRMWLYQNVIGRITRISLKRADRIIVQAQWIKRNLSRKWKIDECRIIVKSPQIDFEKFRFAEKRVDITECHLFYPANGSIYKNHFMLLKACCQIWKLEGLDCGLKLTFTCNKNDLSISCRELIEERHYPVHFAGRLNTEEMAAMYNKTVLVFPSYLETIGLPLMEAKMFNCEILAADCEYAHETIGAYSKVKYFNPFDVRSIELIIREEMQCIGIHSEKFK